MQKRVPFAKIRLTTRVLKDGESVDDMLDMGNREAEISLDKVDFRLRFSGETLPGFEPMSPSVVTDVAGNTHPAMGGWPAKEMNFSVPDDEKDRVNAWITGDFHGIDIPESDKLKKNYQTAVNDLLDGYLKTAGMHNRFTSLCRVAWCAVFNNGERGRLREIDLPFPNVEAPALPVIKMMLRDSRLYSTVEIRNVPSVLEYSIRCADDIDMDSLGVKRIEVYATEQVLLRDPKSEVYGVRTVNVDGLPARCWVYDRYSTDEIGISNQIRTIFKLISNLQPESLDNGINYQKLPISSGKLANLSQSETYKSGFDDESVSGDTFDPSEAERRVYMETEALCLDCSESDKHLHSVTLFGVFSRNDGSLRFTVYGSHHRENWRRIATSRSPYVSGLHATPFRWFKLGVEIRLRSGDFLEAATFSFS